MAEQEELHLDKTGMENACEEVLRLLRSLVSEANRTLGKVHKENQQLTYQCRKSVAFLSISEIILIDYWK